MPGEAGCLKNIGCKGLSTRTLCGRHGWNAQQPQNAFGTASPAEGALYPVSSTDTEKIGSNCITAGHPCMGCTEKGYPDASAPFVVR
jgi:Ni,Fe-hydrogenase I small subunit